MEGIYTRRGHTRNAHRENIHMEGTYTWIHMKGHAHGMRIEWTYTRRGHTRNALERVYTWRGHTNGRDIHMEGHTHERTCARNAHRRDIHREGTYAWRGHTHGGHTYEEYAHKGHTQVPYARSNIHKFLNKPGTICCLSY